jgi:hypothetical protein
MASEAVVTVKMMELPAVQHLLREAARSLDELRALLAALTADEWAGWGMDEARGEYVCFYCHAYTEDQANGSAHKPDCPLTRARVLLGTQPDVTTEEAE